MTKFIISFSLSLFVLFSLLNCQKDEAPSSANFFNNANTSDASVLLVSDDDPTNLESRAGTAFMLDNRGMIYFFVLDLSDEQKTAIKTIHQVHRSGFRGFHQAWDDSAAWEEIKARRDSIHALIYDDIVAILTEDQKALLDEINTQLENGEYPTAVVEYRVQKLDEALDLTDEQETQIAELLADYGSKMLAARDSSDNRVDFALLRVALGQELNEKITALLTEEQLELYNDLLKTKHRHVRGRGHRRP